ncbi:hypothetical protein [Paraflavitalea sp. CAU 1676]|nr:hypothetical protein [Paraflavitalea sp. CAU 1676]MDF2192341.1 hypothetical protein [Paraflavitalea sp. CAU 1676]
MTLSDVYLLIRKITVGVILVLIPLALIAGGIWLAWQIVNRL